MKKILGLDLGTNSIGWAVVNEKDNEGERSSIVKTGVRVIPLTVDEQKKFEEGKSITTNADRTLKRSMRRNLQRYKLRRENLLLLMKENGMVSDGTMLCENGNGTTFETFRLRAKAAVEEISLEELARVLLMINKKRGYKSNRKVKSDEDGKIIDSMVVAKKLYEEGLTPGQYVLSLLEKGKVAVTDFYRSDLIAEFDRVWGCQKRFYPDVLTDGLRDELRNKNEKQTWAICATPFGIIGTKRTTKGDEQKRENYEWRVKGLENRLELEELAIVLQKINGQIGGSSGYLGEISDRSKELFFNRQTVGQWLMAQLDKNPNFSLKNKVFYRQDYLDEFERIWETQAVWHKELTAELKRDIRDVVIFFQRELRSQKNNVAFCELESRQVEMETEGRMKTMTVGQRVCPRSSPLFQEFKIWQVLNNIQVEGKIIAGQQLDMSGNDGQYKSGKRYLLQEEKEMLFRELGLKEKMKKADVLKLLYKNHKELDLNYKEVEGNRTQAALFKAYQTIIYMSGHGEHDFSKMKSADVMEIVESVFGGLGFNTGILHFDSSLQGHDLERQPAYRLWHLLYSFAGDNSTSGTERLTDKISELCGLDREYAKVIANVVFQSDYGNLSAKAMRRILPYMRDGLEYSVACEYAGYRHSKSSLTKEEIAGREVKDRLDILPRNSLRNPVVEKILNQMVNVVNEVIAVYGRPDEIRIELARELKKSSKEREMLTKAISKASADHEEYRRILKTDFGLANVSRNDIVRYKLYLELRDNGFKTFYSNTYVMQEKLFSKEFDIEHIIPQARLFDDSFSNKTIEARDVNIRKGNATALDFVGTEYGEKGLDDYKTRVEKLFSNGTISKTKRDKLMMSEADIPTGFIDRDLRDSQYIAKKAREMLGCVARTVMSTTGSVTDRLREDWQLVDVMKELNWDKYEKQGLTEVVKDKDGRKLYRIKDWTKRNDHRHHAMDALTIAFTKPSYIQYLNNMNARGEKAGSIYGIERKELYRDGKGKLRFFPPMPLEVFRAEAKRQLEDVLISIKAKNKVVTRNVNTVRVGDGQKKIVQLTPRGKLHNETVHGMIRRYVTKQERVNASFTETKIATVASLRYREALMARLNSFGGDAKKAFTGKNTLEKVPIFLDEAHSVTMPEVVKTVAFEEIYTVRKDVSHELKLDKVIDVRVRKILEERLNKYQGDAKKAFSGLDENPIWLNEQRGIAIKRVSVRGDSNVVALHDKHDKAGRLITGEQGERLPADFVSTSNNHHVAIYSDADGKPQDCVVSFYEATMRAMQGLPVVDKEYRKEEGWKFLFTMKQNEYFVFPNEETGFDPKDIDLLDPKNNALISPNLFRMQKMSKVAQGNSFSRQYVFRHHLETVVEDKKELRETTWKRLSSLPMLGRIVKVRVDHIGRIVSIGEY